LHVSDLAGTEPDSPDGATPDPDSSNSTMKNAVTTRQTIASNRIAVALLGDVK
jgi:hypothetical protein